MTNASLPVKARARRTASSVASVPEFENRTLGRRNRRDNSRATLTALMFGALSLLITSFVKTINHFNFYFTGFISPMFFFSGVVFPISKLPAPIQPLAEIIPLTHSVRLVRAMCTSNYRPLLILDLLYIFVFIGVVGFLAVKRLKKRLVS